MFPIEGQFCGEVQKNLQVRRTVFVIAESLVEISTWQIWVDSWSREKLVSPLRLSFVPITLSQIRHISPRIFRR
jgi:hypothetical protein